MDENKGTYIPNRELDRKNRDVLVLISAAFNGGAGVGAALGGRGVRRIGYRNTFLVFTAGFVVATGAAVVKLVEDRPPEDERRWQRPRDEFEEDGDLV